MGIIAYIRDKFNPLRPMGRANYFWSWVATTLIIFSILWEVRGLEVSPVAPVTASYGALLCLPQLLLMLRRSRAAKIQSGVAYGCFLLSPMNLMIDGGPVETMINVLQAAVMLALWFMPNRTEVVAP